MTSNLYYRRRYRFSDVKWTTRCFHFTWYFIRYHCMFNRYHNPTRRIGSRNCLLDPFESDERGWRIDLVGSYPCVHNGRIWRSNYHRVSRIGTRSCWQHRIHEWCNFLWYILCWRYLCGVFRLYVRHEIG